LPESVEEPTEGTAGADLGDTAGGEYTRPRMREQRHHPDYRCALALKLVRVNLLAVSEFRGK
jgi:hypothetical protein